ncbi:MAG TPA: MotA/TolQ/ExbB proton channel family protein [archaeon]|nr:MotA/TolQ/ExbB proton channel family protein [archaeon]
MVKGILFFIIMYLFILAGLHSEGILFPLVNMPSVLIVLGGVILLLYIAFPVSDMCEALGFVFSGKKEIERTKSLKLSQFYQAAGEYSLYCGLWGTLIGLVLMLATMQDPSTIGPRIAVSLITLFYGMFLKLLSMLAQWKLSLCAVTEESCAVKPHSPPRSFIIGFILFMLISGLAIQQAGSLLIFANIPSLLIVLGGSVFGALLFTRGSDIVDALKTAFSSAEKSVAEAQKALKVYTQFNDIVVSMMLLGAVAGSLSMFFTLNDPSTIGPKMALCLLSLSYGILLSVLIRGLYYIVQRKLSAMNGQFEVQPFFTFSTVTFLALALSIGVFLMLILAMSG